MKLLAILSIIFTKKEVVILYLRTLRGKSYQSLPFHQPQLFVCLIPEYSLASKTPLVDASFASLHTELYLDPWFCGVPNRIGSSSKVQCLQKTGKICRCVSFNNLRSYERPKNPLEKCFWTLGRVQNSIRIYQQHCFYVLIFSSATVKYKGDNQVIHPSTN